MPKELHELQEKIVKSVKPREGETKKEASFAIAQAILNKKDTNFLKHKKK